MKAQEKLAKIQRRLHHLMEHQKKFQAAIEDLQKEVIKLKQELHIEEEPTQTPPVIDIPQPSSSAVNTKIDAQSEVISEPAVTDTEPKKAPPKRDKPFSLEEYIGGNLINKIGIVILLIGLSLFVKFAIDNGMMPPFVRVILGWLAGLALVGIAWRLQKKHLTYSAVLFSGGMATLYFTSYLGHTFFEPPVLPRMFTFALMEIFTIINIGVAYKYRQQVVGLIGLVGAYAIPFLLSNNSGNAALLFAYMSIINIGVLVLAAFRNWRAMTYSAIGASWLIFISWMVSQYSGAIDNDAVTGWLFSILFFLLFYATLIVYQFLHKLHFSKFNISLIIVNALIFYLIGLTLLSDYDSDLFGIFTFINGLIHLGVGYGMYKQLEMKQPLLTLSTLFVFFLTIAIPIQFESLTIRLLLWTVEAVGLFVLADQLQYRIYRRLSFIVMSIVLIGLLGDWGNSYFQAGEQFITLLNRHFLHSLLVIAGIGAMLLWNWKKLTLLPPKIVETATQTADNDVAKSFKNSSFVLLPILFISLIFLTFFNEISYYYAAFETSFAGGGGFNGMQKIALFNYTFVFLAALGWLNIKNWKRTGLNTFLLPASVVMIAAFLLGGLPELNSFRNLYIADQLGVGYFLLRYLSFALIGVLIYTLHRLLPNIGDYEKLKTVFPLFYHFVILVILSNELTTFFQLATDASMESVARKVGYSILWGLYALFMIVLGFWKEQKILRLAGIALFAITLIKVFSVDLQNISTVSKTIVFIALGVLLLIISYLYQRFEKKEE